MSKNAGSRFLGFFITPLGRKVSFYAAGTTTIGLFFGNFLPHTLGLQYYKDFVQCYQNGIPRAVPEKVLARLEKAFDILEVRPSQRKLIKPFSVFGFDIFQAGSTDFRFGCMVGIPVNYSYSQPEDINASEICFRNEQIKINSEYGKLLQQSIILNEDEQIFGLCKSILLLQSHRVLLNSIFPSISFLTMYTVGSFFNQKLNLYARPLSLRFIMYTILGLFGVGTCYFMKDFNQVTLDTDVDKKLSTLGPEFVSAGVSYYDKILKKNMALRALIGDDTYTAKGNENYLLRQKSLPLTIRKSFFEEKWQEITNGTQSATQTSSELPQ